MEIASVSASLEDKELIRRVKSGDKRAYESLIDKLCPRLYAYLFRMLGSHEDAEDILQEALESAYLHIHQFKGRSQFSTWLYRIAINNACRALKKRKLGIFSRRVALKEEHIGEGEGAAAGAEIASAIPGPSEQAAEDEEKEKVRFCIARLPKKLAEAITLRELEGLTYDEISARLNIARGTVMSRLNRARLKLARHLKKLGLG